MGRGFVITGTDTAVGKTVIAAGITAALGGSYWKPIQAGLEGPSDSEEVIRLAGPCARSIVPEAYRLSSPCSPHESARLEGQTIELPRLELPPLRGPIVVEGAGGLMVPIEGDVLMIDLFARWSLPVILVARTTLGTINHSLLSLRALRDVALEVAGIVFVGEANAPSEEAVITLGKVRHLGRLCWLDPLDHLSLLSAVRSSLRLDLLA